MSKINKKAFQSKSSANIPVSEVSQEEGNNQRSSRACPLFCECNAPLCPMDGSSLKNGVWYSDEEICPLKEFSRLTWVRKQKKLATRANPETYFVLAMLNHKLVIKKGISGLDPDNTSINDRAALKEWLMTHPERKQLTDEAKEIARQNMLKIRITPTHHKKDRQSLIQDTKTGPKTSLKSMNDDK